MLSIAVTFLLALTLSVGGVVARRGGWAESGTPAKGVVNAGGSPAASTVTKVVAPPEEIAEAGGGFPGVVLLPPLQSHTALVAPPASTPRVEGLAMAHPMGIPFSGEYWMFKPPRTVPPLRSIVRRGNPSEISFHTTDGATLEMEAHQKLDQPVDIRCCRTIQLFITNTDHYPGSVSLELILIQNDERGGNWVSLGTAPADSALLNYPVPAALALHSFDEFKVVFHRTVLHAGKSARVAIERFLLVP